MKLLQDLSCAQYLSVFVCAQELWNLCVSVCISSLLSFSRCVNVKAGSLDLPWHMQTAVKARMLTVMQQTDTFKGAHRNESQCINESQFTSHLECSSVFWNCWVKSKIFISSYVIMMSSNSRFGFFTLGKGLGKKKKKWACFLVHFIVHIWYRLLLRWKFHINIWWAFFWSLHFYIQPNSNGAHFIFFLFQNNIGPYSLKCIKMFLPCATNKCARKITIGFIKGVHWLVLFLILWVCL